MVATTFTDSFYGGVETFFRGIPTIIGALLLLVIGWIIAGIIGRLVEKILDRVGADRLTQRAGIDSFLQRAGVQNASAGMVARFIVTWWIRLIVLEVALPALGIAAITTTLDRIVAYVPSIFAAILIVVVGAFLARLAGEAVRGLAQGAGFGNPQVLERVVQATILVLTFVAALQQVDVAATLVNELLVAVLAAMALAAGLAFGLGGREVAASMLGSAYRKGQDAQQRIQSSQAQPAAASQPVMGRQEAVQPITGRAQPMPSIRQQTPGATQS